MKPKIKRRNWVYYSIVKFTETCKPQKTAKFNFAERQFLTFSS